MGKRLGVFLLLFLLTGFLAPVSAQYSVPERGVIYQVMVDRFYDGNQSNNEPFYDASHTDYRMYWGGDLEGLIQKLDYIKSLGVDMIWVSPLNDNINKMAYASAPYHGYWPQDFKRIEEHFGTWETFRKLVEEARKRGICVIVDYVPNHSNPATAGSYGALYDNGTRVADYLHDEDRAKVNPYTGSKEHIYHHNGDIGEWYGFQLKYANLYGLADFNQHNPWVDGYLKEGAELFADAGACGFRVDAVKHMDLGWLETLYLSLYRKGPLFIYGEYYNTKPDETDDLFYFYQYSNVTPLLSIPIRETLANTFAYGGSLKRLSKTLTGYYSRFVYPNKAINFLDSHDLVRFLNMNRNRDRFHMALALTMTLPGIPVIYYGDESYLVSKDGQGDPYNRPMMVFNNTTEAARIIRTLAELRKANDALAFGDFRTLYADYRIWVFERTFGNHSLLVAVNKGNEKELNLTLNWPDGNYTDALYGVGMEVRNGTASLSIPSSKVLVFHREGRQEKPLIGSITPYAAEPGDEIVLGGAAFGAGGEVFVGGVKANVTHWGNGTVAFILPELKNPQGWIDVYIRTPDGESNHVKLRYYSGNEIPALIAIPAGDLKGYLWIKGNLPELSEPRPLLKSDTGYYFTVAPLPNGTSFEVELYDGLPWEELEPTGRIYHGTANWTTVLEPGPLPRPTATTTTTTTTTSTTATTTATTTTISVGTATMATTTTTTTATTQETTPSTTATTTTTPTTTSASEKGGICGPAFIAGLPLLALFLKRR
ncbi:alpha-amylase [Thermococcus profundus]|uniref:Alpha-amylase n=1 Tax=Thermococcus profundus TaxID=49899 RepID=A0A2Z2M7E7_THEPR|nr:alpha-amylase family glycosyl hydrolase [Thermococcus profundus]ASJ02127.1 alpha-amylase [Thermococcus profundus]